ncbi:hypothetical protein V8C86DRAFT_2821106 [Haematococcus lacustris]
MRFGASGPRSPASASTSSSLQPRLSPYRASIRRESPRIAKPCWALPEGNKQEAPQDRDSQPSSTSSSSGPPGPAQPSSSPSQPNEIDIDVQLQGVWEDIKLKMAENADPETAKVLSSLSYDDLVGSNADRFFRQLAAAQLGPFLEAIGNEQDPYEFFLEVVKLACSLQLITCGCMFYGVELWGHLDAGEAFRATIGLALGYMTRPLLQVEVLLHPVYNMALELFDVGGAYKLPSGSSASVQSTLNKLGVTVAVLFIVPQLCFGWSSEQCGRFVGPLVTGWLLFDVCYLTGLLLALRGTSR